MAGQDRISALPLELKISILSCLNIRYILRTSLLSRSWRHVWTHIPELTYLSCPNESTATALRRVDHLISSLHGPIFKFLLYMDFDSQADESSFMQKFMETIFEKGDLHVLGLFNSGKPVQFCLPQFNHLRDLDLRTCSVALPRDFKGFECLTKLCLMDVCVSNNDLQLLIDSSGNLTDIELFLSPTEPISVKFTTPLLTYLHFKISDLVMSVNVVHAPCLQKVKITGRGSNFLLNVVATQGFMTTISDVSYLGLDWNTLFCGWFQFPMLPKGPSRVHFHQLKCLQLYGRFFTMNKAMYETFCRLFKSVPVLEELEVQCCGDDRGDVEQIVWDQCKKQDGFPCLDQTLKSVRIDTLAYNFVVCSWMPHFILLNANVLKLMEIHYFSSSNKEKMNNLHQIKPVSPDAKLLLKFNL